tara:strand:+ start:381 stop:512 length:132 start_codon:yes stop_codon:yes gene_type:complete
MESLQADTSGWAIIGLIIGAGLFLGCVLAGIKTNDDEEAGIRR